MNGNLHCFLMIIFLIVCFYILLFCRCAHAYSESIRLKFPTAGLQNSLDQYSAEIIKNKKIEREMKMKKNSKHDRKVFMIFGPLGCGVQTIGGLIEKGFTSHEKLKSCPIGSIHINLFNFLPETSLPEREKDIFTLKGMDDLLAATMATLNLKSEFSRTSAILIIVTSAIGCYLPQADLLQLLTTSVIKSSPGISVSLAGVVAVVSPKSISFDTIGASEWYIDKS